MSKQIHKNRAEQRRRARAHMLANGKVKAPGLWERLRLRRLGRTDGKRGLPARGEDGCWRSALLDAEANAYEEVRRIKTVLWVSRHELTVAQRKDLERVLGKPIELLPWKETVKNISELMPLLCRVDVAAVVLPPELIAELLPVMGEKPVLRSVSARRPSGDVLILPDGRKEPQFDFVHLRWERIVECRIVTQAL